MKKQYRWLLIALLLLSLSSLACALTGGDDGKTAVESITDAVEEAAADAVTEAVTAADDGTVAEAVEAVTEGVEEAGAAAESVAESAAESVADAAAGGTTINADELGDALDFASVLNSTDIQSYQFDMVMEIDSETSSGQTDMAILYNADPLAMSVVFEVSGDMYGEDADMGEISMVRVDDWAYMTMAEMGCIKMPADESDMMDELVGDMFGSDIVDELQRLTKVGSETVNGEETTHYTFDEAAFLDKDGGMETAEGHVYISKENGYMVRMIIDGSGDVGEFTDDSGSSEGTVHFEMNLTNVNQPVHIEAPTDCEGFSDLLPSDGDDGMVDGSELEYPVLDDAADMFSMAGMVNYSTGASLNDAAMFYQTELPLLGWVEDVTMGVTNSDMVTMVYSKDGKMLTVAINNDPNAGTTVTLMTIDE